MPACAGAVLAVPGGRWLTLTCFQAKVVDGEHTFDSGVVMPKACQKHTLTCGDGERVFARTVPDYSQAVRDGLR